MKPIHALFTKSWLPLTLAALMAGCGGDDKTAPVIAPAQPLGLGYVDTAAIPNETTILPFVDNVATNQRGDARYATKETNAGVRVVAGFLDIWQPSSLLVDAGQSAPASESFPAVTASTWTGIPKDATDGKVLNQAVHEANINYVINATTNRTSAQELAAYLDDRRGKAYSISDGLGPLTEAYRTAAQQITSIKDIPVDAATVLYNDTGNNVGVGGATNTQFGTVVDLVANIGANGSTEPAKRYFKYARPWRWSSSVKVAPSLEPAKSKTPTTDGGFISGHTAESVRGSIAMAYAVPERFQEMVLRGLELGENRILSGMHSPLDVIGGRIHGTAVATASLVTAESNANRRVAAYTQAHSTLMAAVNVTSLADFNAYAHSGTTATDRFADYTTNKTNYLRLMTFGFSQINDKTKAASVPKSAEVLLETRLPYLDAAQRRVVLKTTALASGYPIMDDPEGWGRLNLFAAADGYGRFDGDVTVTMNASLDGFNAKDSWRNDIAGAGKLTKKGTGALHLTGNNSYTGGTLVEDGVLVAESSYALGNGEVYVIGGRLDITSPAGLKVASAFTQIAGATNLLISTTNLSTAALEVKNTMTLTGGMLIVNFAKNYTPKAGDTIQLVNAGAVLGKFTSITINGQLATVSYSKTGISIKIN